MTTTDLLNGRAANTRATASLRCTRSPLTNASLFPAGSVLKAHLTFTSPCRGAGSKSEEPTGLTYFPHQCYLIIQKLWDVLLHGSMQPECLFSPCDARLRASIYAREGSPGCVYRLCMRATHRWQWMLVVFTQTSHLHLIQTILNYGRWKI